MVAETPSNAENNDDLRLQSVVKECNTKPHTPELINNFWQIFLETFIKNRGLDIPVPMVSCDKDAGRAGSSEERRKNVDSRNKINLLPAI